MKRLLSLILCSTLVCFSGGVCNSSEINGTDSSGFIYYCENNDIESEEDFYRILYIYLGEESNPGFNNIDTDTLISFDLNIDYDDQYVITTTVYETESDRGSTSGYAIQKYWNNLGIKIFEVRVDGSFSYNGSTCSTTSATATFTPAPLLGWSSNPSSASGKSGNLAYARAYGTAVHLSDTQSYSVCIYCDVNGNLSSS